MKYTSVFLLAALSMCACTKNHAVSGSTTSSETPGPVIELSSFPLQAGHIWVYDNGDTIKAVADTVINGVAAVKMVKTNQSAREVSYYANQADGFYQVGTSSDAHILEFAFGMVPTSAVTFFSTPLLLAQFPVTLNSPWDVHDPEFLKGTRQWTSYVSITTKAGKFDCVKLTSNSSGTEYYSSKGLVRVSEQPNCLIAPCPAKVTDLVYVNF